MDDSIPDPRTSSIVENNDGTDIYSPRSIDSEEGLVQTFSSIEDKQCEAENNRQIIKVEDYVPQQLAEQPQDLQQPSTSKGALNEDDKKKEQPATRKRARKDSSSSDWSMSIEDDLDTDEMDSDGWNFTDDDEVERRAQIRKKCEASVRRELQIWKQRYRLQMASGLGECRNDSNAASASSTCPQQVSPLQHPQRSEPESSISNNTGPIAPGPQVEWWRHATGLEPPDLGPVDSEEEVYINEFEVASVSDINENPIENVNSSSEADEPSGEQDVFNTTFLSKDELDVEENFADGERQQSDSEPENTASATTNTTSHTSHKLNSTDSELSDRDKWICTQCHSKSLPYFRYCLRCFRMRRNWLPKRPKSRRLKQRNAQRRANRINGQQLELLHNEQDEDEVDGPCKPRNSIIPSGQLPSTVGISLNEAFLVSEDNPALRRFSSSSLPGNITLGQLLTPPNSQSTAGDYEIKLQLPLTLPYQKMTENTNDTSIEKEENLQHTPEKSSVNPSENEPSPSNINKESNLCSLCCSREKDAAFVHNKIAHHYCCFVCADKILKKDGKCPICRHRVLRVVRIISA